MALLYSLTSMAAILEIFSGLLHLVSKYYVIKKLYIHGDNMTKKASSHHSDYEYKAGSIWFSV